MLTCLFPFIKSIWDSHEFFETKAKNLNYKFFLIFARYRLFSQESPFFRGRPNDFQFIFQETFQMRKHLKICHSLTQSVSQSVSYSNHQPLNLPNSTKPNQIYPNEPTQHNIAKSQQKIRKIYKKISPISSKYITQIS